jgi:tRNA(Ile)-lysidine synthetase-like protein
LFRVRLAIPGVTPIPGTRWQIRAAWRTGILQPSGEALGRAPCRASLRAAAVGRAAVFVRAWQAGDAIHPLGVDGHKKIQDIFVDAKLPRAARQAWPLVECRGQIAWLPGYRIAQAWALRQPQEQALHLILEELPPN